MVIKIAYYSRKELKLREEKDVSTMIRGITFEIPNTYGSYLSDILEPLSASKLFWSIGEQEIYKVQDDKLSDTALLINNTILENEVFWKALNEGEYYVIFSDLKAYSTSNITTINTYADFLKSDCLLALLIADSNIVTIYCRDSHLLELLYKQVAVKNFKNIEYITDENDVRTYLGN